MFYYYNYTVYIHRLFKYISIYLLFQFLYFIQIIPNGEEMIPAIIHFGNALHNKPLKK